MGILLLAKDREQFGVILRGQLSLKRYDSITLLTSYMQLYEQFDITKGYDIIVICDVFDQLEQPTIDLIAHLRENPWYADTRIILYSTDWFGAEEYQDDPQIDFVDIHKGSSALIAQIDAYLKPLMEKRESA